MPNGDSTDDERNSSAARRKEILNLAMYNLEVGRQSLHDSQFSSDAKLIEYYEGAALCMRSSTDPDSAFLEMRNHFDQASKLREHAAPKSDVAQRIVGLEGLCNLATVEQRQALLGWRPPEPPTISVASRALLRAAIEKYDLVLNDSEGLSSADMQRIQLTALLGLFTCKFGLWSGGDSYAGAVSHDNLSLELGTVRAELNKGITEIRYSLTQLGSTNHQADSSASLQILGQIKDFLDIAGEQLRKANDQQPGATS
jgi:hypothetical protein